MAHKTQVPWLSWQLQSSSSVAILARRAKLRLSLKQCIVAQQQQQPPQSLQCPGAMQAARNTEQVAGQLALLLGGVAPRLGSAGSSPPPPPGSAALLWQTSSAAFRSARLFLRPVRPGARLVVENNLPLNDSLVPPSAGGSKVEALRRY